MTGQYPDQSGGNGWKGGEYSFIIPEAKAAVGAGQKMPIDIGGEVPDWTEIPRPKAWYWNQLHDHPVTKKQAACHDGLSPDAGVHYHQGGEEVTDGNALQNAGDPQLIEAEVEQAVVNESKEEEDGKAAEGVPVKRGAAGLGLETPSEREGQDHTHNEEEQGKDQVVKVEALPRDVFKLPIKRRHGGMVNHAGEAVD